MKRHFAGFFITSMILASCSDEEGGSARLQVAMVDAPADYIAVYIDVQDVMINRGSGDEEGWSSIEGFTPAIYNLLELTNGNEAMLGDMSYPEGNLGQVRLVLGENNSLVTEEDSVALTVPSGSQSGLKVNINQTLEAGVAYKLIVDFDAAKSVVKAGNSGKYNLKPVIRAQMEAQSGAITGVVLPDTIQSTIHAIMGTDTLTTYTDAGHYLISAVPEGTYELVAMPEAESGFSGVYLSGVEVITGEVVSADTLVYE